MKKGELNHEFIEGKIGYIFTDKSLIDQAFTTKSYEKECKDVDQPCESQESLRTIGDAILKKILIELLLEKEYSTPQQITETKSTLESGSYLAALFKYWDFTLNFFNRGSGEVESEGLFEETVESLIGAIYFDTKHDVKKTDCSDTILKDLIIEWFPLEERRDI